MISDLFHDFKLYLKNCTQSLKCDSVVSSKYRVYRDQF